MAGAACEAAHEKKGAMCVLWRGEDRGQRERHVWRGVCSFVALCTMILCIRRLWARARAGALVLAWRCVCNKIVRT